MLHLNVMPHHPIYTGEQYVDSANHPVMLRMAVENVTDRSYWANSSLYRGAARAYLMSATIDF